MNYKDFDSLKSVESFIKEVNDFLKNQFDRLENVGFFKKHAQELAGGAAFLGMLAYVRFLPMSAPVIATILATVGSVVGLGMAAGAIILAPFVIAISMLAFGPLKDKFLRDRKKDIFNALNYQKEALEDFLKVEEVSDTHEKYKEYLATIRVFSKQITEDLIL